MERKRWFGLLSTGALIAAAVGMFLYVSLAFGQLQTDHGEEAQRLLEESIHRAAVACYAAEGCYPPDLAYMQEHYGVQIDEKRYDVHYDCFAQNLMPDITVLDKGYEETI